MSEVVKPIKLGLLREGKVPPDSRVALTPRQAAAVHQDAAFDVAIQPSPGRCYADADYQALNVPLQEDLTDRDVLIGIKEVPVSDLIEGKTYIFFSHTHKGQLYNRGLLRAVVEKHIRLIDYELLTDSKGSRLIAFGAFAGMVGAHHALRAWGQRSGHYDLPAMRAYTDYAAAVKAYAKTDFAPVRVVLTGSGRVGQGAAQVLNDAGLRRLTAAEFLDAAAPEEAVYTQLASRDYVKHRAGAEFDKAEFYNSPQHYISDFARFAAAADVLVHGIFWDERAPALFALAEASGAEFRIQVIADVTCDIAPQTSIPTTVRASTIADPYFHYDPVAQEEVDEVGPGIITMCTIDNLPNELPRDASKAFGKLFMSKILPELQRPESVILARATIAADGAISEKFRYLNELLHHPT